MRSFVFSVIDRVVGLVFAVRWAEPIRALGAVAAVLTVVVDVLTAADVKDWYGAVPVLLAEVFRRFVFSPASLDDHAAAAFDAGYQFAKASEREAPPEAA